MATWRAEITRDGNGNLVVVSPERAPEWVGDLIADVIYRFRDAPDGEQVIVSLTGRDGAAEEPVTLPMAGLSTLTPEGGAGDHTTPGPA